MRPLERFVKLGGLSFRYLELNGGAARPTVVLYHATGFVSELWLPVIHDLGSQYRYLALDQRGHGGSDKKAPAYTWAHTADDFQAFLQAMQLKGVVAVGHSSGATAIAVTAARAPGLFERMVLIEPTIPSRAGAGYSQVQRETLVERTRSRRAQWPSRGAMQAGLAQRPPFSTWTDEMLHLYVTYATALHASGVVELLCTPEVEAQIYQSFPDFDPWLYLPDVHRPVLVIHGTGPSVMPTTPVAELIAVLPHARLVELSEGGHLILMEAPHRVAECIRDFLRDSHGRLI